MCFRWQTSAGSKRWTGKRLRIILTEMSTEQLIAEITGDAGYADKIDTKSPFLVAKMTACGCASL